MVALSTLFQSMFIRGGRRDNLVLFVFGHILLIVLSVISSVFLFHRLAGIFANVPNVSGLLTMLSFPNAMGGLALLIWVHEIGHYAQFRRFGAPVFGVLFPPFGGIMVTGVNLTAAELIESALAGPLTGIVALPLLMFGLWAHQGLFIYLALVWVGINLLNLLPVYPMDGGWILVSILSYWVGKKNATRIAWLTSIIGVFFLYKLINHPAIFVLQIVMLVLLVMADFGASKIFTWFSKSYLNIVERPYKELSTTELGHYSAVYITTLAVLGLIFWLCWIYNPFPF